MKKTIIFCDGSSSGNPGPGGWGAIFCDGSKVKELGGGEKKTTNNRMEILASINAISLLKKGEEADVFTDSQYLINGITKWVWGWMKKNWKISGGKGDVANRDLWEKLAGVCEGKNLKWHYVSGHTGVPGNERCDEIAVSFSLHKKIELFDGTLKNYKVDLEISKMDPDLRRDDRKKKGKIGQAYSYLSLVNGVLKIDKTWKECENRVKGIKGGVKYKKSVSAEDERAIIKEWGM